MEACQLNVEQFLNDYSKIIVDAMEPVARKEKIEIPVITLCMQPGSGGYFIARHLADRLGFEFFNTEILRPMANGNNVSADVLASMEKHRFSGLEDLFASLLTNSYLHPDRYCRYLKEFISPLGKIGKAVIVGRGANFILPKEERFAVRVIAPMETRVKNVAFAFGISLTAAKRRIKNRAAKRRAFIRENFHADIDDALNYDLIINTARLDVESSVDTIFGTILGSQFNRPFRKNESYILRKCH